MEERMTICNMSIEMGARGGLIAPDEKTFDYLRDREFAPSDFDEAVKVWELLKTDQGATFDKTYEFDANDIAPMITYGTNPAMGISIDAQIPNSSSIATEAEKSSFKKSLQYMGLDEDQRLIGKQVNYVFIGSCTNSRIEDLRAAANIVKGNRKAKNVTAFIIPGSKQVERQAMAEGLDRIFEDAGFEFRQPGCSACLSMNDDKIPAGEYCVSTSNRNFEGRQGPGSRTLLASPITAAASAITGKITDVRKFLVKNEVDIMNGMLIRG